MGWKNVKEYYKIGHTVQVCDGNIHIGSPYVYNLISIGKDGKLECGLECSLGTINNQDLKRYHKEMTENPEKLLELIQTADKFENSITVYTYNGSDIIEKQCEKEEWPNLTHDGEIMYDNTFSSDKNKVMQWARRNLQNHIEMDIKIIADREKDLKTYQEHLENDNLQLNKFNELYPVE